MSNSRLKSMPYRISDGDMELMKIRSSAAVARAAAEVKPRRRVRWAISMAMAVSMVLAVVAIWYMERPMHYELFIEQLADVSADVLYDMSVDVVEYEEDMTFL